MGSGFSKMKKQARLLQQQMDEMQEQLKQTEVTGSAGNGLVTVTINGEKEIKNLSIKPECVDPEDVEGLQDLIIAAFSEALKQLEEKTPSMDMPGMSSLFGL
ncbi:MAG: YbaB/EbfC family nucleoid-associated protein [Simkaniaceae bacterium]